MIFFLKRLFLFMLPVVFVILVLEFSIRAIPNSYELKTNYLKDKGQFIETLILGSSHTFYGLNPKWFTSNTFNAANVSQSPAIDLKILETYDQQLSQLKQIIIRLSYDTLFEQLKDSPEDWRLKDYKLYSDLDLKYDLKHNSELMSTELKQSLKTFKRYYFDHKTILNCDRLGFGIDIMGRQASDLEAQGPVTAKKHTASSWRLLRQNIETFKEIVEWADKKKVSIYVVTPPAYQSYRSSLDKLQYTKMTEVGETLDQLSEYCTYINFIDNPNFRNEDYYDPDHLNALGARKFSKLLDSIINN